MKATGVVRRIDDLGRIVIPKEIRKNLRIKDGESLEIFLDSENIILKRYSPLDNLNDFYKKYVESIYSSLKKNILITDRDRIIAVAGDLKKEFIDFEISSFVEKIIQDRVTVFSKEKTSFSIVKDREDVISYGVAPIIVDGDAIGSVIVLDNLNELDYVDEKIIVIASKFLSKYIE